MNGIHEVTDSIPVSSTNSGNNSAVCANKDAGALCLRCVYSCRRYAFDGQPKPFARFSFAWLNERELPEAVRRIAAARP